jgi:ribosome maturation factor RimP
MKDAVEKIREILLPKIAEENLYLVDVKVLQGKRIQVFVDGFENITINQCTILSRYLEEFLDKGGIVPMDYGLELSSPGMTNPLKVPQQYKKRIGSTLDIVKTSGEKISGRLIYSDDEKVVLEQILKEVKKKKKKAGEPADEEVLPKQYELTYAQIKSALIQFNFK